MITSEDVASVEVAPGCHDTAVCKAMCDSAQLPKTVLVRYCNVQTVTGLLERRVTDTTVLVKVRFCTCLQGLADSVYKQEANIVALYIRLRDIGYTVVYDTPLFDISHDRITLHLPPEQKADHFLVRMARHISSMLPAGCSEIGIDHLLQRWAVIDFGLAQRDPVAKYRAELEAAGYGTLGDEERSMLARTIKAVITSGNSLARDQTTSCLLRFHSVLCSRSDQPDVILRVGHIALHDTQIQICGSTLRTRDVARAVLTSLEAPMRERVSVTIADGSFATATELVRQLLGDRGSLTPPCLLDLFMTTPFETPDDHYRRFLDILRTVNPESMTVCVHLQPIAKQHTKTDLLSADFALAAPAHKLCFDAATALA